MPTQESLLSLYERLGGMAVLQIDAEQFIDLSNLASNLNACYSSWTIPKKNGKPRLIEEPVEELKRVQRALIKLFDEFPRPGHIHGLGGKHYDACANASKHIGKSVVVQMDIKDFFPSTIKSQASWAIATNNMLPAYIQQLMLDALDFCFVKADDCTATRLPMGAPTSPVLANIAFYPIDDHIAKYAKSADLTYTRYMDDLTFSSDLGYRQGLQKTITQIVEDNSEYKINHKKSTVSHKDNHRQMVTGVCVNTSQSVGRQFKKLLRAELDHHARTHEPLTAYLKGKLAYVKRVNPEKYIDFVAYWHKRNSFYCQNPSAQVV